MSDAAAWVAEAPWAALALDGTGCIRAANAATAALLGRKPAELSGAELSTFSLDPAGLRRFIEEKEGASREFEFRTQGGNTRWLALALGSSPVAGIRLVSAFDVTSSRQAADALREERDRYLDMIRAASDWFWESERIRREDGTTKTKLRLIRPGRDDVKRYERETDWPEGAVDPSYDPEAFAEVLKNTEAGKSYRNFVHRERRTDGKERYYRAGGVPYHKNGVLAGYRGISIDVTAQVLAERRLRRMQRHLEHAQRVAAIGSAERDLATGNIEWSEELYRLIGVAPHTFDHRDESILALVHPEDRARVAAGFARARSGQPVRSAEFRVIRPDGEMRILYAEADLEYDAAGKPVRLLTVFKDVTELRRAEQKQREQLQHAQKLETLGTLASGVAHDLNNTLVPILALGKMMAKRLPPNSREQQNLNTILQASERARDLVKQILAFSRKEAARRAPVDVAELARQAFRLLRASVPSTIAMEPKIEAVPPVLADDGQLHQVITNLVTNAAHAIGGKSGTIGVEVAPAPGERIAERTQRVCGAAVRLSVSDTGSGMDEATLARIFEPFFTTKPLGEGTGLGLSMVQGIVTQHGGVLTVASTPGQGTRFDIYLPALEAEAAALLAEGPAPGSAG